MSGFCVTGVLGQFVRKQRVKERMKMWKEITALKYEMWKRKTYLEDLNEKLQLLLGDIFPLFIDTNKREVGVIRGGKRVVLDVNKFRDEVTKLVDARVGSIERENLLLSGMVKELG